MTQSTVGAVPTKGGRVDRPVFLLSGGFVALFLVMSLFDIDLVSKLVNTGFAWSTKLFGAYWQLLLLLTFVIGIFITVSPAGSVRMGGIEKPEMSTIKWIAIILCTLFGIPDTYATQLAVLGVLVAIYTISAISGVTRGIQILSRISVSLGLVLMAFILFFGPTAFIIDGFVHGMGTYLHQFIPMALFRADPAWLDWWTVFFWGWFLGYGPLMAMFVAKISRGRTIRETVSAVSVIAPLVTCFWFTIVGGSGIAFELAIPGSVSGPFEGFNLPAALLAVTQQLPLGYLVSIGFLVLTMIFVATTGDSMTYTIAMVMTGSDEPNSWVRIFWGVAMGVTAGILISIGSGGISALQYFIVITAVPVSLILLPSLWVAPRIAPELVRERDVKRGLVPAHEVQ